MNTNKISSIYLHFPFCKHLCNYCDFYKLKLEEGKKDNLYNQFAIYLEKSTEKLLEMINQEGYILDTIDTLYMGGGTPSLWGERGIKFLESWFENNQLAWGKDHECTLEVDPGTTDPNLINNWMDFGVNRFSVGIQTLHPEIFPYMDRSHGLNQVYELLQLLQSVRTNFSVDFMLGLPHSQKFKRSIQKELEKILSFNPKHISLYFLTVSKNYQHYLQIPDDLWIEEEYLNVIKILKEQGFKHYEVASFAKPGFESQHNQKYWTHQSVLALGPSATGFLSANHTRYKWKNNWLNSEALPQFEMERLSLSELELEWVYLTLRQGKPFLLEQFEERGFNQKLLRSILKQWELQGYIQSDPGGHYCLLGKGWLILDTLIQQVLTCK